MNTTDLKKINKIPRSTVPKKFTDQVALQIRKQYQDGHCSYRDLVEQYNTCLFTIGQVLNAKGAYAHLCSDS